MPIVVTTRVNKKDQEMIFPKKYCFYTTTTNKRSTAMPCSFFLKNRSLVVKIDKKSSVAVMYHFSTKHNSGHRINGHVFFIKLFNTLSVAQ